ncbi:MAG TPA: hypothetical protein VIS29_06420 [Streptomyces sp.]|jgi:hypothetical protein
MARPGEFEYYAGLSGLPSGTLDDHKLAYFRAQTADSTATLPWAEYAFYKAQTLLDDDFDTVRLAYYKAQVPLLEAGTVDDYMTAFFSGEAP